MQIILNGEPLQLEAPTTIAQLLHRLGYSERKVAVELNRRIVPRSQHAEQPLADGDRCELVQAFGGG